MVSESNVLAIVSIKYCYFTNNVKVQELWDCLVGVKELMILLVFFKPFSFFYWLHSTVSHSKLLPWYILKYPKVPRGTRLGIFNGFIAEIKNIKKYKKITNICGYAGCKRVVDVSFKVSPSSGNVCLGEKLYIFNYFIRIFLTLKPFYNLLVQFLGRGCNKGLERYLLNIPQQQEWFMACSFISFQRQLCQLRMSLSHPLPAACCCQSFLCLQICLGSAAQLSPTPLQSE